MGVQERQMPIPSSKYSSEESTQGKISTCGDLNTTTCKTPVPPNESQRCTVKPRRMPYKGNSSKPVLQGPQEKKPTKLQSSKSTVPLGNYGPQDASHVQNQKKYWNLPY